MRLIILIISWLMLAVGVIAFIGLVAQADSGTTGEAPGIVVALGWIIQSLLILIYLYKGENNVNI